MTIKLQIEITSPLTVEDHEMLSGITVMTLAIANRHLAEERFPDAFNKTENEVEVEATEEAAPAPLELVDDSHVKPVGQPRVLCGAFAGEEMICPRLFRHTGRHAFRNVQDFLRAQAEATQGGLVN